MHLKRKEITSKPKIYDYIHELTNRKVEIKALEETDTLATLSKELKVTKIMTSENRQEKRQTAKAKKLIEKKMDRVSNRLLSTGDLAG